jgi:AraC family transcriptional regulator, ethanolamine operon transcriptional activator
MAKPWCRDRPNTDLDEFISRFRGFHLELLQTDQGMFRADGVQTFLGDLLLATARLGRAQVQTWKPPAQSITIAVRTSRASALWQGTFFGPSDLLVSGPGAAIQLASQPGFCIAIASFPNQEFQRAAEFHGCGSIIDRTKCVLFRLPKARAAHEIQAAIQTLICEASAQLAEPRHPKWEQAKRDELLHRIILAASGGVPFDPSGHNAERAQVLNQAVSAIKGRPSDVLTVAALCRIVGASERTLHYAFVERYGLPPARFMKACRLNGARSDLSRINSQGIKISDVANKWGFWHLGQFAKDYRLWFGELPSETCRRYQAGNYTRDASSGV